LAEILHKRQHNAVRFRMQNVVHQPAAAVVIRQSLPPGRAAVARSSACRRGDSSDMCQVPSSFILVRTPALSAIAGSSQRKCVAPGTAAPRGLNGSGYLIPRRPFPAACTMSVL
jgi:hypothetical protein